MKHLLIVLLVLVFAVPAGADALIYNMKVSDAGAKFNGGAWGQYKEPEGGFLILGMNDTNNIMDVWTVWTWKSKDGQKCAGAENWGQKPLTEVEIPAGKTVKQSWAISFLDQSVADVNRDRRVLLTGAAKPTKIANCSKCHTPDEMATFDQDDITPNIAASMTGYAIFDDEIGDPVYWRNLRTRTISLKLNTKLTVTAHDDGSFSAEDAMYGVLDGLYDAEYDVSYP
jgi:hypothetical protein